MGNLPEMTTYIENRINKVCNQTDTNLADVQARNNIKYYKPEIIQINKYVIDDYEYKINTEEDSLVRLLKILNLPMTANTPMNFYGKEDATFKYAMTYREAVERKYVPPIIFLKKKYGEPYSIALDWEEIWICKNGLDVYLILENYGKSYTLDDLYGISLPLGGKYINRTLNPSFKPRRSSILFNEDGIPVLVSIDRDGNYDQEVFDSYSFGYDIYNKDIICSEFGFEQGSSNRGFIMSLEDGCELFVDSIILYKDGDLMTNSNDHIEKVNSNTFVINDTEDVDYTLKVYYYTDTIRSCNNIYHLDTDNRKMYLRAKYSQSLDSKFLPLYDTLNLDKKEIDIKYRKTEVDEYGNVMHSDPEYLSNYRESLYDNFEKILKYRKDLLYPRGEDTEFNKDNISVYHIPGKVIMDQEDPDTFTVTLNQKLWYKENGEIGGTCKPVIFVNNKLYTKYHTLEMHNNGTYSFNSSCINRDDDVEIYYFGQTPNIHITNHKICTIPSDTKTIDCGINMRNALIFEKEPIPVGYDLSEIKTDTLQYHIPFEATINGDGSYTIIFEDESYYDTEVVVVPNTQFITFSDVAEEGEAVNIVLPESFKYAHNIDQYMVFINGRRISNDCLEFNIPKKDNPFYELSIYSSIIFAEGDRADVIYLPFSMNEVCNEISIPNNAVLKSFQHDFPFGLNLENYMIFVNGMKINNNEIEIVSDDTFKLKQNVYSTDNLSIINIATVPTQIDKLFNTDDWNNLVTDLTQNDIVSFYKEIAITEDDANIRENETYKKAILLEIYRDYYGIHYEGVPLVYTTNEELLDDKYKDIDDNILVDAANGRVILNINYDKEG